MELGRISGRRPETKQREDRAAVAFPGLAYEHDLPEAEHFYRSVQTGSMPLMTLVDEEFWSISYVPAVKRRPLSPCVPTPELF